MDTFELSIVINRPSEAVFEYLANLENDLQWRREWVDARKTSDGAPGVGATFRLTGEMFGRQIPTVYGVTEYEPCRTAAWKAVSGPFPLAFRGKLFSKFPLKGTIRMSTLTTTSLNQRNSLLRFLFVAGLIIGTADAIIFHWFYLSVLSGSPITSVYQYIASGVLGEAAFAGGIATALLGLLFHYLISLIVTGVFLLSADRIPLLRRYAIIGSLLYGFGVFIVMNLLVVPLSATPPLPAPTTSQLIINILDHLLIVGLPLGLFVRRSAN